MADPNLVYVAPRLIVNFDDSKRSLSNFYQFRPGDSFTVRYLVQIDANAAPGTDINNLSAVDWGTQNFTPVNSSTVINCPPGTQNVDACATSILAVGGAPGVGTLSGQVWHDSNFDEDDQTTERPLAGWEVQVYFGTGTINPGDYVNSVLTDVNGNFSISGLIPNTGDTKLYGLRFVAPGASTDTASLGNANSIFSSCDGPQQISYFDVVGRVVDSTHEVLLANLSRRYPSIPVVAVADEATAETRRYAWEVVRAGAPVDDAVRRAAEVARLRREASRLGREREAVVVGPVVARAFEQGSVREMERLMIEAGLGRLNQNRTHAAASLEISVRTLRNKLREYREAPRTEALPIEPR